MRRLLTKPWSPTDIDELRRMVENGASVARCSAAFGRPCSSIKVKARALGLVLDGVRIVRARQKAQIAAAESSLPRGSQRFDGSRD